MKTIIYIGGFILPDKNAAAHRVVANAKIFRDLGYRVVLIGVSEQMKQGILECPPYLDDIYMYSIPYPQSSWEWAKYNFDITSFKHIYEAFENGKCYY